MTLSRRVNGERAESIRLIQLAMDHGVNFLEMQALRDRMRPYVNDGQSEPYKTTTSFDNKPAASGR